MIDQFQFDQVEEDYKEYDISLVWARLTSQTADHWANQLEKFSQPSKFEKIFSRDSKTKTLKWHRYAGLEQSKVITDHMQDALLYGTGVWFDEEAKEVQETTDKDTDGKADGVAQGQLKIQPKEKAQWRVL
jgi:hypothetical protein